MSAQRLLVVAQPVSGGVPRHVVDLVSRLDPAEYEVHVACPPSSFAWKALAERPAVHLRPISLVREPGIGDVPTLASLLPLVADADLVHAHSSKAGFLARLAAALTARRRQCIFTPHGWSFWSTHGRRSRTYLTLERLAAHWCRRIVAVSDHERAAGLAARVGRPDQYRVIRNGVDLARFAGPHSPVEGSVVFLGRLAYPKRLDVALVAFAEVAKHLPNATLTIVGDGPDHDRVLRDVAARGLSSRVAFLGDRDDVPAILARSACLLLTSDSEGCPLSVIEAMAAGVPVVASRVGGVPELIDDGVTGLLAPPGDAASTTHALLRVLRDPAFGARMGLEGRMRARLRFGLERMVAETVRAYRSLSVTA